MTEGKKAYGQIFRSSSIFGGARGLNYVMGLAREGLGAADRTGGLRSVRHLLLGDHLLGGAVFVRRAKLFGLRGIASRLSAKHRLVRMLFSVPGAQFVLAGAGAGTAHQ